MIVKKMPILQGFPDFETVKNLSGKGTKQADFSPVFYDIEKESRVDSLSVNLTLEVPGGFEPPYTVLQTAT